jgi:hypothetical protein
MSDPTNPKDVRWIMGGNDIRPVDVLETAVMEGDDCVRLVFGQSVGNMVVEVATLIVQRDVAEAFGGSLLSLGNKLRPGE